MEVLFVRELVARLDRKRASPSPVTITMVNPGMCFSAIGRELPVYLRYIFYSIQLLLARRTEVGARTLVYGACAGPKSHGEFMSDGKNQDVERWIYSDLGKRAQVKLFDQTMRILEERRPGIGAEAGLSP
jgi:retinol dehydrogenase 12